MKKIVVLDGYTANPGDLSWSELAALGNLEVYDRTAPNEVIDRAAEAEIILTNKVLIGEQEMTLLPKLRYIGVLATGYNVVDIDAAHRRGIVVTNIPAYSTMSVAQMVFAHLLNATHHVADYACSVKSGNWQNSVDFCFYGDKPLIELDGLTMGLVGLGNTGSAVARIALSFGMKVLAFTCKPAESLPTGVSKAANLEQLFSESDVLSLHCPLTPATQHLVNRERLGLMKPSAIVINTGRGPLVDDQALADALNEKRIAAACIDVLTQEPPRQGNPLIEARNCQITPHVAWATLAARRRLLHIAASNVAAYLRDESLNRV
ncbi:MAG: D-2-hydroxyacid dehydrogenase [Bacteroidales bacterium]|nr:D-2-hydroxyacid dehydrogenase [Bacteroidales bacterium]